MGFKIDFDILDYKDIYPEPPEDFSEIINYEYWGEKDYENCIWRKHTPPTVMTIQYKEREVRRIIKTGVWCFIKDQIVWLPGNYYFFLQYFNTGGEAPEFRLKMLKYLYFKIRARNNKKCIGTMVIKQRQEGLTTIEMSNALHEMAVGIMDYGQIGIQSKSRDTVKLSCWRTLKMGWQMIPRWLKDILYYDIVNDGKIEETIKFRHDANDVDNGRDILISFGASVHNAFDSFNNMRSCIFDEWTKWSECSLYRTFLNYKKFIVPGGQRKGLFTMISSPSDTNGKHSDEAFQLWKKSEFDEETKTSESGLFRYYMSPLEGIDGYYDKFGDADGDVILAKIKADRAAVVEEFRLSEIRAYPLNEDEMFATTDGTHSWSNSKGIIERKLFLTNRRFKDDRTKEPVLIYGNLQRIDGNPHGDVEFRMSDKQYFDLKESRFAFSYLPLNKEHLRTIFQPPSYVEACLGVDPFNLRYPAKHVGKQSNGAMVCRVFRDLYNRGYNKCPTMIYNCRVSHQDIFHHDVLNAAIFNRAMINVENKSDKFQNFAEDYGYSDWLLPEMGQSKDSVRKGDGPAAGRGKNDFLEVGMGLIDANTNTPLVEGDPYYLQWNWFIDILTDYLAFNPLDTHANDISMADMQSLYGGMKILNIRARKPSPFNSQVLKYALS